MSTNINVKGFLFLMSIILFWTTSCSEKLENPYLKTEMEDVIETISSKNFFIFKFDSNIEWKLVNTADWLSTGGIKYGEGSGSVKILVAKNDDLAVREANLVVTPLSADLTPILIKVRQNGTDPRLDIGRESLILDGETGETSVSVSSNVKFTVASSESWLAATVVGSDIKLTYGRNESPDRDALITVSAVGYDLTKTLTVTQKQFNNYTPYEKDVIFLKKFYEQSNHDEWVNKWDINADPQTWYGLTWENIDGYPRLRQILMWSNNMTGSIPEEVAYADQVYQIHVGYNHLSGTIPMGFEKLTQLSQLALACNDIEGTVPAYFAKLPLLTQFWIDGNRLSGEIPQEILSCKNWPDWESSGFRRQQEGYGFTN